MKEKLLRLMDQLQLRPGQFARILEVNPAIISHIVAERNKPGVDLLQKILTHFPQVSPDWLLLGTGEMFRDASPFESQTPAEPSGASSEQTLFSEEIVAPSQPAASAATTAGVVSAAAAASSSVALPTNPAGKQLARVVLCYTDGTCESFCPNR